MIGGRRPLTGPQARRPPRPRRAAALRRTSGTPAPASWSPARRRRRPRTRAGRALARMRRGRLRPPALDEEEIDERLSKKKALAIFSSDAISSSAYATEEILRVLVLAGAAALLVSIQVAIAIALLLAVVSVSLPPGLPRLSERRRRLRRRPDEPGAALRADRRRGAADRLRHDRRGLDVVGARPDPSVVPAAYDVRSRDRRSSSIALITIAQPPRPARVREHLRGPDLPVRRARAGDRRHRAVRTS